MASALESVKKFLQGSWMGHPLHPALVHIPTGAWPAAMLFDLYAYFRPGDNAMVQTAFWCIVAGIIGAMAAAPTGMADFAAIKPEKPARKLALIHAALNVGILTLFIVNLVLRYDHRHQALTVTTAQLALSIVATAILGISGYIGGRLTYHHGVGVARFSKDKWRNLALAGNAVVADKD